MRVFACLALVWVVGCSSAAKNPAGTPPVQGEATGNPPSTSGGASGTPTGTELSAEPKVRQFRDRRASGWTLKDDDQAFELERTSGCTIKWNVAIYHARPKELVITVRDTCRFDLGLSRSLPYYGQILDAILAKYSKDRIKTFQSSSWRSIKAWDQELAVASIESGLWKNFLKKREDHPELRSESVFVDVFNEGNIARKLAEVFETRGLTIHLKSVVDVHESRFKKTPFAHEYAAYSSSSTKVPLSAGTYVFEVKLVGEP